jgi:hypothetical protein
MPVPVEFSVAVLFSIAVLVEHRVVDSTVRVPAAPGVVSVPAAQVAPVVRADAVRCTRPAARPQVEHRVVRVLALDSALEWAVVPALAVRVPVDLAVAQA